MGQLGKEEPTYSEEMTFRKSRDEVSCAGFDGGLLRQLGNSAFCYVQHKEDGLASLGSSSL